MLSSEDRKSRSDRINFMNIMLSQYDYLPKRIKSITFTDSNSASNFNRDSYYSGNSKLYLVIPQNNIKIAIVPSDDFNKRCPYSVITDYYEYPREFTSALFEIISKMYDSLNLDDFLDMKITIENFKEKCDEFESIIRKYDIVRDDIKIKYDAIYKYFIMGFLESNKKLYDYFIDVFEPIKAGIKIIDFSWKDMKDPNYRNQFIGKECWIDTKCLLIKKKP